MANLIWVVDCRVFLLDAEGATNQAIGEQLTSFIQKVKEMVYEEIQLNSDLFTNRLS